MKKIRKQVTLLGITILLAFILCSAASAANSTDQTSTVPKVLTKASSVQTVDSTISGVIKDCQTKKPFAGVKVKVTDTKGKVIGTTTTNSNGLYKLAFSSAEKVFNVTASYPGHITATKKVTVKPVSQNTSNPKYYAKANFLMGTLTLTKGSWDIIGLDSNNVNVGPSKYMVQIRVTNSAATTAQDVVGTFNFTSANANINLDPLESATKNLGDIAPGQTKDLFWLVSVNRTNAAYFTSKNYSVSVAGTNTGSPDVMTGSLYVEKLLSQNRNHVVSIVVTPTNPTLGSIFGVTVTSTTSSSNFNYVSLPLTNYDPTKIEPVSVNITYGANTSKNILLVNPGENSFISAWTFRAIGAGQTPLEALILDKSGSSFHYNSDYKDTSVIVDVTPKADLAITKSVNDTTPDVGDNVTFTITATNNGPNNATGVKVTDILPAGLSYVSSNPSTGSYNDGTGIWTIGNLNVGQIETLIIVAKVVQPGQITNCACIKGKEKDPNLTNNKDCVSLNGQAADLQITKTVDKSETCEGDHVTFTITLTNSGPNTAQNVTVKDILPAGLELISATPSDGSYNPISGVWTIGSLIHGASVTMDIVAKITTTGTLTNTAEAFTTTYDPTTPNKASASVKAMPCADLGVIKKVNNTEPNKGENVTFTITATNYGPSNATGVQVEDILPVGLSYISNTPSTGFYNSVTGIWTIGNLNVGDSETLQIVAKVIQNGEIINIAKISGNEKDPNPLNNQDIVVLNGKPSADLAVLKTVDNPTPYVGDLVTFTVKVFNQGPDEAENVIVNDALPTGLQFVSANPSIGNYDEGTGIWSIGNLAHLASAEMTIIAKVMTTGLKTNIAIVSSDTYDPHPEDNTSAATVNAQPSADLAVVKKVNNSTPNVGDNITFTINVINHGPSNATGVTLTDNLPAGLSLVSATPTVGTYLNGIWSIGNLNVGDIATLTIVAKVLQSGLITNIATVTGNEHDPNPENNQDIAIINGPPSADLSILKTVDNPTPYVGDNVKFTIKVFNAGPNTAEGVVVNDVLPAGLQFVSANPSVGTYNSVTGVWSIGNLAHQTSATMTIVATVLKEGIMTNLAKVTSNTYDPHPTDNSSSATVDGIASADLAVVKTVDNNNPTNGDQVTFTITVTNNGPSNATGVKVYDLLPTGMTLISATPSTGGYNGSNGMWDIGNLAKGDSATMTLLVKVTQSGELTNIAVVSGNEHDPNTENNQSSITITVKPASFLVISKTVSSRTVNVGDNLTFTINVENQGPDTALNTRVSDVLPDGYVYISSSTSMGTYNPETEVWTIGDMPNGSSATLTMICRAVRTGVFKNTAVVESDSGNTNPDDNSEVDVDIVNPKPVPPKPVPVNGKTVPMKTTGAPIGYLLLAALMVIGGLLVPRRK